MQSGERRLLDCQVRRRMIRRKMIRRKMIQRIEEHSSEFLCGVMSRNHCTNQCWDRHFKPVVHRYHEKATEFRLVTAIFSWETTLRVTMFIFVLFVVVVTVVFVWLFLLPTSCCLAPFISSPKQHKCACKLHHL